MNLVDILRSVSNLIPKSKGSTKQRLRTVLFCEAVGISSQMRSTLKLQSGGSVGKESSTVEPANGKRNRADYCSSYLS